MIGSPGIQVFNTTTAYSLTLRTAGASAKTSLQPGKFGRGTATVDLYNNDGALTPGGGGTYSSFDWFTLGITIFVSTSSGTVTVFEGIITDFDLTDDGRNSMVRITAVDGFTVGGSSQTTVATGATSVNGDLNYWINSFYNGNSTYINSVGMPKIGNPTSSTSGTDVGINTSGMGTKNYSSSGRAGDFVNNVVMPSGPNFAWPTYITTGSSTTTYGYSSARLYPIRSGAALKFTFKQSPTAGQFPIQDLRREFNSDELYNTSNLTTIPIIADSTNYSTTASNSTSVGKYGTRQISLSSVLGASETGTDSQTRTAAGGKAIAERWANTYSDSEFVTKSLVVTDSAMTSLGLTGASSVTAYKDLLDIQTCLLQLSEITYKPTGASSNTTDYGIIMSRQVDIKPSDIKIRVVFMVADRSAFILDNTYFGKLDQNRLG